MLEFLFSVVICWIIFVIVANYDNLLINLLNGFIRSIIAFGVGVSTYLITQNESGLLAPAILIVSLYAAYKNFIKWKKTRIVKCSNQIIKVKKQLT